MPNLQRFVSQGVMGNIATLYPVLSPMLWTSIATGKRAYKHGIHGFIEPDPRSGRLRPITNLGRKCKAVWNILSQHGKRCNVIGWWPSHPAEPINGVMVSNHFQTATHPLDQPWPVRPGSVHPAGLVPHLSKFRVHPGEIDASQILPFVPRAAEIDQEQDRRLAGIAKILAEMSTVHAVATAVMQHEPWDFMGVYFDAIDHFCHGYMRYHPPREEWVNEKDFELYQHVIDAAYQFHDVILGVLLTLAGDETTVILLSDHGFHPDHLRPRVVGNEPAGPADEHRQFGIFAMRGPGIKEDELVFGTSLLDVTPTILTLFGLPLGRDLDGRPVLGAFQQEPELAYVDSWDEISGNDGRHPAGTQIETADAQASLKQLVDLGYIDRPDEDQAKAVAHAVRELRYNLARDYFDAMKIPEAAREFAALWDEFPDESRFGVKLFDCYLAIGNTVSAEETLDRLVREKRHYAETARDELRELKKARQKKAHEQDGDGPPVTPVEKSKDAVGTADHQPPAPPVELSREEIQKLRKLTRAHQSNPAAIAYFRGCLLYAKGEFDAALAALERADGVQAYNQPSLRQKMGECYVGKQAWSQARAQFQKVLDIDPINAHAHLGLAQCELGENRPQRALAAATSALGLIYHQPKAHFLAGKALYHLGRIERAIAHLETALRRNRVFPECHRLLARVFARRGDSTRCDEHQQLAKLAEQRLANFREGQPLPEDADLTLDVAMDQSIGIGEMGEMVPRSSPVGPAIIVVSGLPRSGTSMMMQMLVAGGLQALTDGHRGADESNRRGYFEFEPVKKLGQQHDWVADAGGKAVKIVAPLLPYLPAGKEYRIVYMARPLAEIVTSQAKLLQRLGQQGASLSDRRLAATYKQQMDAVTRVLAKHEGVSALTVEYADALSHPREVARRVNSFLGGHLDETAMAASVDPTMRHERIDTMPWP